MKPRLKLICGIWYCGTDDVETSPGLGYTAEDAYRDWLLSFCLSIEVRP